MKMLVIVSGICELVQNIGKLFLRFSVFTFDKLSLSLIIVMGKLQETIL